jgi:hypothetical protein
MSTRRMLADTESALASNSGAASDSGVPRCQTLTMRA